MIRRQTLENIHDDNIKFFVANCKNLDDPVGHASISYLSKKKFSFGIILNGSIDDPLFDGLDTPLYSTVDSADYFHLDVCYRTPESFSVKKYRFIFVDIEGLYVGDLNMPGSNKNELSFLEWLTKALIEGIFCDGIFVISNKIPFYYLLHDATNEYINNFLDIIYEYGNGKIYYLSTDNDYFNCLTYYNRQNYNLDDVIRRSEAGADKIFFVLSGKLAMCVNKPIIFEPMDRGKLFDGYYESCKNSTDSGFVEIILDNNSMVNVNYNFVINDELIKFVVNQMIRLVNDTKLIISSTKNQSKLLANQKLLKQYYYFAKINNFIQSYKALTMRKKMLINIQRMMIVDKLYENVNRILEMKFD